MGHCKCEMNANVRVESCREANGFIKEYWKVILSLLMLIAGAIMNQLDVAFFRDNTISLVWYILAYLPVGLPVIKEAWESILQKDFFSEFTLMSVATLGAFYIGEYPEGVAVMLFYSVGELFQDKAIDKAKRNISALLDVRPEKAVVVRSNEIVTVDPRSVLINEIIEIKAGERVPLDGVMLDEVAAFNTAALTGESVPRDISRGEEVLAGMIVTDKVIRMKVTKPFDKSALARILELVEDASERKAPAELFIRKFARVYTPIVIGFAFLIVLIPYIYSFINPLFGFVFNDWLYKALVFLVISCPCALVISIPLSFFAGLGGASHEGVLVKGSNYLETLAGVKCVVFDKTGTMTQGVFEVIGVHHSKLEEQKLLEYAAHAECHSTHPISKSLCKAYQGKIDQSRVTDVEEIGGNGIIAVVDGKKIAVGNSKLMRKIGVACQECHKVGTVVHVAIDGEYSGHILIADVLKPNAKKAIEALHRAGIAHTVMLTGDDSRVAAQIAEELRISEVHSELLPGDKVTQVEALLAKQPAKSKLAFVGDGINDAPVLSRADIGIAMGALGSDAAIEAADVVLMDDDPLKISKAIRIARKCIRIVYENIYFAIGIKLLCLLLGAIGIANMWFAIFADVGVMVLAVLNAIRALFVKKL